MQEIAAEVPIATTDQAMTVKHHIENRVGGTYGSPEAAAGWQRSGVARLPIEPSPSVTPIQRLRSSIWTFSDGQ